MRRIDWFLAAIVAAFLVAVAVQEVSAFSFAAGRASAHEVSAGEVTMQRIVSRLPVKALLTQAPE
ncbi:MAG TPA: hypothetical protein VGI95_11630 [Caulobacteraceae bacterium]|jgi:hypothetical protein